MTDPFFHLYIRCYIMPSISKNHSILSVLEPYQTMSKLYDGIHSETIKMLKLLPNQSGEAWYVFACFLKMYLETHGVNGMKGVKAFNLLEEFKSQNHSGGSWGVVIQQMFDFLGARTCEDHELEAIREAIKNA